MILRLSSRQSALAQAQAYQVGRVLEEAHPHLKIEYHFRESLGDKNLTDPLWKMPEKGVFTEDFFQDLVENKTDLVVHSWKDLPTEKRPQTHIVATLPRADQRDLLLFKKSSLQKTNLQIYSSSPRRAHNILPFLQSALPWKSEKIEFQSVRGNIPTRVQKLLQAEEIDGLILAKAALDRLLADKHFPDTVTALRKALTQLEWMVLPLSENPNAAAQGALAIEISTSRPEILQLMQSINHVESFKSSEREREILREFGGGCHLALGMSVLERPYGRIEIVKGLTPQKDQISSRKFFPVKKHPADLKISRLKFEASRQDLSVAPTSKDAIYISKTEAYNKNISASVTWCAGVKTWKKLAEQGVWVHGCSEGLGDSEESRIQWILGRNPQWARLTHDEAPADDRMENVATYRLNLKLISTSLEDAPTVSIGDSKNLSSSDRQAFLWKSASEFLLALQAFPKLRDRFHICGPGRTYDRIRASLGNDQNLFVELGDEFITVI